MCKIITFSSVSKVKDIKNLAEQCRKLVAETEKDGFGYAIQGERGVFGERTTEPRKFKPFQFINRVVPSFNFLVENYNRFGTVSKASGGAIFHGRTSTNDGTLLNTHPLQKHGWTLIHNGVVTNHGPKYDQITTNDTEHVLELLATKGIHSVASNLTGYYAVTAFDQDGRLHVIRDDSANLFGAWFEKLESFVFATRADHITTLAKYLKQAKPLVQEVGINTHVIFKGNEILSVENFEPRGYGYAESKHASKSLGYSIQDATTSASTANPAKFTQDELDFLAELSEFGDSSYSFYDFRGNSIEYRDFQALTDDDKLCCSVVRPDGTVVDQNDYHTDKLYMGAV